MGGDFNGVPLSAERRDTRSKSGASKGGAARVGPAGCWRRSHTRASTVPQTEPGFPPVEPERREHGRTLARAVSKVYMASWTSESVLRAQRRRRVRAIFSAAPRYRQRAPWWPSYRRAAAMNTRVF